MPSGPRLYRLMIILPHFSLSLSLRCSMATNSEDCKVSCSPFETSLTH